MNQTRRAMLAASALLPLTNCSWAGDITSGWPKKPVKLLVNFPPGGSPDVVARAIAQPLQEALGQPVVVENRAGASGNIGTDMVVKAPADGYTFLVSAGSTISINPHLYGKLPYDPFNDLAPVAALSRMVLFLVTRPHMPFRTVSELLSFMRGNPDKLTYGSAGNGTGPHLAGEMLKNQAGVQAVHVPYKGSAPALQDLLGGQIDFVFDPGIAINHVKAGRLLLIAVAGLKRSELFADVPTLDESGLKGFDAGTTHGVFAPVGTPRPIVTRMNQEINRALKTSEVRRQIAALGADATPMSAVDFLKVLRQDDARYSEVIKARKITAD